MSWFESGCGYKIKNIENKEEYIYDWNRNSINFLIDVCYIGESNKYNIWIYIFLMYFYISIYIEICDWIFIIWFYIIVSIVCVFLYR